MLCGEAAAPLLCQALGKGKSLNFTEGSAEETMFPGGESCQSDCKSFSKICCEEIPVEDIDEDLFSAAFVFLPNFEKILFFICAVFYLSSK